MQSIESLRHACPERAGFQITRKNGHPQHTFLHFFGSVELLVNGKIIRTAPHACILYPAGEPQFFHSPEPLTHDWIHFSGDLADAASLGIFPNTVHYPEQPKRITQLTKELEAEFYGTLPQHERMLALKLEELWVTLRRAIDGALAEPVSDSLASRLHLLRTEMLLHPDKRWTVAALSKAACLSESRFYSVYRSYFGNSPIEDLITARMDTACNMLIGTETPVSQIAKQLGYANVTHFTRQFKAHFGLSPTVFRNDKI
jgi:AraC-like DNA-binding protein